MSDAWRKRTQPAATIWINHIICSTWESLHIWNLKAEGGKLQTLAVQSEQPLLDSLRSLWYALHPHHWPMRCLTRQRMLCAVEDFFKKILGLATGEPCESITDLDTGSEVHTAL